MTHQYLKNDSLTLKIVKEECFLDGLLLKEEYRNDYMSSEYDGTANAEYLYNYNKEKRLIRKYCIESFMDNDTVKYEYLYSRNSNDVKILISDYRKRFKKKSKNNSIVTEEDYTTNRTWKDEKIWIKKYDDKNRLIEHYEPTNDIYSNSQNRYTYKYENDKLVEKKSFLSDNTLYWTEILKYKGDSIITTHTNENHFPIPFYTEIQLLDENESTILLERFNDKNILMRRYKYVYDSQNRLIRMQCFNEKNELMVTHKLTYELLK